MNRFSPLFTAFGFALGLALAFSLPTPSLSTFYTYRNGKFSTVKAPHELPLPACLHGCPPLPSETANSVQQNGPSRTTTAGVSTWVSSAPVCAPAAKSCPAVTRGRDASHLHACVHALSPRPTQSPSAHAASLAVCAPHTGTGPQLAYPQLLSRDDLQYRRPPCFVVDAVSRIPLLCRGSLLGAWGALGSCPLDDM